MWWNLYFPSCFTSSNSWCCQINMCVDFDISRYFKQTFLCKGKHSKLNKNKNLFAVCWTFYDLEKTFVMTNFNNSIIAKIVRFLAPQKCFSSFELKCVVRNANNEKHWQQQKTSYIYFSCFHRKKQELENKYVGYYVFLTAACMCLR